MRYETVDIPDLAGAYSERQAEAKRRYNRAHRNSPTRKASEKRRRQRVSIERYLTKPFVAWDGEGYTLPPTAEDIEAGRPGEHIYNLLANSDGQQIIDRDGISTVRAFEMFLRSRDGVTNIIYGGNYDINMILKDVPQEKLRTLYEDGSVWWQDYLITWRIGKSFHLKHGKRTFLLYDILPFFQTPFVQACDDYLGTDWPGREQVIADKARRGTFTAEEIEDVTQYNEYELQSLTKLADELRDRLWKVGIRVSRWDGPGAIATAIYKANKTKHHIGKRASENPAIYDAVRRAYAGGRFEIIRKGHSESGAYQYDINSAYPAAFRNLPCLAHGTWHHVKNPGMPSRFGVYRVSLEPYALNETRPQPLWQRNRDKTVVFSRKSHGWYWTPEVQTALKHHPEHITVHEGWEWHQTCDHVPFSWIDDMYAERQRLKAIGDGAQVGLKLGLNSLYGKTCQQVGWDPGPPLRIPPYHCLEWAGYITSHCRAAVYDAAMLAPDDIIAFETDAVFTRVPLDLPIGKGLGEWEETEYKSLTYFKSGMSFGTKVNGEEVRRTRGIDKDSLTREDMIQLMNTWMELNPKEAILTTTQTRFYGLGQALHQDWSLWRRWVTSPRILGAYLRGKRWDIYDNDQVTKNIGDGWEETFPWITDSTISQPHKVEWVDGPQSDVQVFRDMDREYDDYA